MCGSVHPFVTMDLLSRSGKLRKTDRALGRRRSISSNGSARIISSRSHPSSPVNFMPPGSHQIPISSLYQNVTVPSSCPVSYPCSPVVVSHATLLHNGRVEASSPVFYPNAQVNQSATHRTAGETKPIREAVLHSKTSSCRQNEQHHPRLSSPKKPKMHLYASRKTAKNEPKEEDFPLPPDNWLLSGSNSAGETSSSASETQSGTDSEDESEDDGALNKLSSFESLTSVMAARSMDTATTCQMLSLGLKALLKVSA